MAQAIQFQVSADEREQFVKGNAVPDQAEVYVWLAFNFAVGCWVELYTDELKVAEVMARKAGLDVLAGRLASQLV